MAVTDGCFSNDGVAIFGTGFVVVFVFGLLWPRTGEEEISSKLGPCNWRTKIAATKKVGLKLPTKKVGLKLHIEGMVWDNFAVALIQVRRKGTAKLHRRLFILESVNSGTFNYLLLLRCGV